MHAACATGVPALRMRCVCVCVWTCVHAPPGLQAPFRKPYGWATWGLLGLVLAPVLVGVLATVLSSVGYEDSVGGKGTVDGVAGMIEVRGGGEGEQRGRGKQAGRLVTACVPLAAQEASRAPCMRSAPAVHECTSHASVRYLLGKLLAGGDEVC